MVLLVKEFFVMEWETYVPDHRILEKQREKLGLSQEEVAARAAIEVERYRKLESGERTLTSTSRSVTEAVLTSLELDITAFFKGEYSSEPVPKDDPIYKLIQPSEESDSG